MHEKFAAKVGLAQAARMAAEDVQEIELARAEVPSPKKKPAGVPNGVGGAQKLDEGLVAGAWAKWRASRHATLCLDTDCRYINKILAAIKIRRRRRKETHLSFSEEVRVSLRRLLQES